jgi:hypothetical protein
MKIRSKFAVASAVAALFAVAALNIHAAEAVKSDGDSNKPARAIEDGQSRSMGVSTKPARAVDDGTVKTSKKKKAHNRAIEGGAVKAPGTSEKASRAADQKSK